MIRPPPVPVSLASLWDKGPHLNPELPMGGAEDPLVAPNTHTHRTVWMMVTVA